MFENLIRSGALNQSPLPLSTFGLTIERVMEELRNPTAVRNDSSVLEWHKPFDEPCTVRVLCLQDRLLVLIASEGCDGFMPDWTSSTATQQDLQRYSVRDLFDILLLDGVSMCWL